MQLSESEKINEAKQLVNSPREKRLRSMIMRKIAGLWLMGRCMMLLVFWIGTLVGRRLLQGMVGRFAGYGG